MDPAQARSLQAQLDSEVTSMKSIQESISKLIPTRQKLLTQYNENTMVKKELDLCSDNDSVYKLTGPVLIKCDVSDAQSNINNRIKYFTNELERIDINEKSLLDQRNKQQEKIQNIQNAARHAYQQAVQSATKQQSVTA